MSRPMLRSMTIDDLDQVGIIERVAFTTPWSTTSFVYDLNNREHSNTELGVIELPHLPHYEESRPDRFQLIRPQRTTTQNGAVVSYGSMWIRNGEGHISQLAVHHLHRGQQLGELMLVGLLARAIVCGATFSALEVRVSNVVAQSLYVKYGFQRVAILPRYYSDNREDAYLMKILNLNSSYISAFRTNVIALMEDLKFSDMFSGLRLEVLNW